MSSLLDKMAVLFLNKYALSAIVAFKFCIIYWLIFQRFLGTNPISCAAPSTNPEDPFVLDMATTAVAQGKVSWNYI